jgi:hypothetical protein
MSSVSRDVFRLSSNTPNVVVPVAAQGAASESFPSRWNRSLTGAR